MIDWHDTYTHITDSYVFSKNKCGLLVMFKSVLAMVELAISFK